MSSDAPPRRDVAKWVTIAIGVLVGAAGLVATFYPRPVPDIRAGVVGVGLDQPGQITVTFEIEKAPLASARCQVAAFGKQDNVVAADAKTAWRLDGIEVGPRADGGRLTRRTVVVPTPDGRATQAAVSHCAITRTR